MISKINFNNASDIRFQGNTNLLEKFKENLKNQNTSTVNLNGSEALSNYNKSIVKTNNNEFRPVENLDDLIIKDIPKPIKLHENAIETLSGDRILNSDGNLETIITKGDNTTKEYYIDTENKSITKVIERDNTTNMPIRKDIFGIQYNTLTSALTQEFVPGTNKIAKETLFNEGKVSSIKLFNQNDNKIIENRFGNNETVNWIDITNNKTGITESYTLNSKNGIEYLNLYDKNFNTLKNIDYEDGKIKKITNYNYKPIKNIYGITPENINIKPADLVKIPDIITLDGEKKFRSNNSLESITVKDGDNKTIYLMSLDGKNIETINEFNKGNLIKSTYFNDDSSCNIKEFKNGKQYQTTYYNSFNKLDSVIQFSENDDKKLEKYIDYSSDGSFIRRYSEENNPEFGRITLEFDENKNLIKINNENRETIEEDLKN